MLNNITEYPIGNAEPQDRYVPVGDASALDKAYRLDKMVDRAKMLIHFLPFGSISKQALQLVTRGDKNAAHHLVRRKYIEKNGVRWTCPDRKRDFLYYSITPKGIEYILHSGLELPQWFLNISAPDEFAIWGGMSSTLLIRMISFQDAIAFFTMGNVSTILTELWEGTNKALFVLLCMRQALYDKTASTVMDMLLSALMDYRYSRAEDPGEIAFLHTMRERLEHSIMNTFALSRFQNPGNTCDCYTDLKEAQYLKLALNGSAIKSTQTLRDNCIGIYVAKVQDYSVYMTTQYGIKYAVKTARSGMPYNSLCASLISGNSSRPLECRCTSAILLCRTAGEMARAVLDPYRVRSKLNQELGAMHDHVYLVPMSLEGSRLIEYLRSVDPISEAASRNAELRDLAELYDDIMYQDGRLIDLFAHRICLNGTALDTKTIYRMIDLLSDQENPRNQIILFCEEWQQEYYQELLYQWELKENIFGRANHVEIRPIRMGDHIRKEGWNNRFHP